MKHPSFGALDDSRIIIFDTTLRDGEQSPGFSMNLDEKLRVARALEALGVDVIEAGFPVASPGDFESVRRVAEILNETVVCGLARSGSRRDIEVAGEAIGPAKRKRIHHFISTSPLHMKYKLRMEPERVLELIGESNRLARQFADDVQWSAEDASRTEPDFLCRCVEVAIANGANTINVPDTVGYAVPDELAALFEMLRTRVPGAEDVIFSAHNHNDLGLGVANALAALDGGARQVECTINGIGERAGNAALEEFVMALRTRRDRYDFHNRIDTTRLLETSRIITQITGSDVQPNKAIVGRNAFAHESGIHQDGVLKHAQTYEIMTPESVGWSKTSLIIGKHSGRAAFRAKLAGMGYTPDDQTLERAFARFKILADQKKSIFDEDLRALMDDETRSHERIQFIALTVHSGSQVLSKAELTLAIDGEETSTKIEGNGPVDAAFKAINVLFPRNAKLALFSVGAVTEGTDAQALTTVRLEENGRLVDGRGADADTVVAATRAYIHALNQLCAADLRASPQAVFD